jgi:hypothetical protein
MACLCHLDLSQHGAGVQKWIPWSWAWWCMPVIPVTQEVESGFRVHCQRRQKLARPYLKAKYKQKPGSIVHVVKYLPSTFNPEQHTHTSEYPKRLWRARILGRQKLHGLCWPHQREVTHHTAEKHMVPKLMKDICKKPHPLHTSSEVMSGFFLLLLFFNLKIRDETRLLPSL